MKTKLRKTVLALALVAGGVGLAGTAQAGAFITNGTITLGVNDEGHLNVFPTDAGVVGTYPGVSLSGTTPVGLRYNPTGAESTAPGCVCEGWGAGIVSLGVSGYANRAVDGIVNLSLVSFSATASTATSVVEILSPTGSPVLRVTHFYHPSPSANLYQVDVTIQNLSGTDLAAGDLVYRRVMDWDVEPTPFSEFVTIQGVPAALGIANGNNVRRTGNDGFDTANPLASLSGGSFAAGGINPCSAADMLNSNFTDCGADDHGAVFDFEFEALANGASRSFVTYYGAAGTEAEADAARALVGAGLYSYGQCDSSSDSSCSHITGAPNTFIFAFGATGGVLEPPPPTGVPEPGSLALVGLGLMGLAAFRSRKRR
ncbi:MAG: PEP-CTERM sorting domain-containing protein [Pseudomonadota bacterium]